MLAALKLKHTSTRATFFYFFYLYLPSRDHSNVCSRAAHMKAAPTSTNRLGGEGGLQTRFKRREVLKTEPSARATPALRTNPKLKTQDERIRLWSRRQQRRARERKPRWKQIKSLEVFGDWVNTPSACQESTWRSQQRTWRSCSEGKSCRWRDGDSTFQQWVTELGTNTNTQQLLVSMS